MSRKPHFLQALLKAGATRYVLRCERTGEVIASELELTSDSKTRRRGLLGRTSLSEQAVLIIAPCNAVHTFFMKFTIDVVFTDRDGGIVKLCRQLRPWRMGATLNAFAALEFSAGTIERQSLKSSDRFEITML